MRIIKPSVELTIAPTPIMINLEQAGRVCYKSEDKITDDSCEKFLAGLIRRGHESVLEHEKITVRFIVDRGVSHEIVRHRIASYSQESTRYNNYSQDKFGNEITVIEPYFFKGYKRDQWEIACEEAEEVYFNLLEAGATPQEARTVLPNSLKTELIMTTNIRDWRHFFKLRADGAAHPQMRQVAIPLLIYMKQKLPVLFNDIEYDLSFPVEDYAEVNCRG